MPKDFNVSMDFKTTLAWLERMVQANNLPPQLCIALGFLRNLTGKRIELNIRVVDDEKGSNQ